METLEARFRREARLIRKLTGTAKLETAMRKTLKVLSDDSIPHLIGGGLAVQEWGYARSTKDVDIIVPNVRAAHQILCKSGFEPSKKSRNAVVDPKSQAVVDLLPGGEKLVPGQPVPFPLPTTVSLEPQIVPLDILITMKLSAGRRKDLADVVELVKVNSLPENYSVDKRVQDEYHDEWEMAMGEQAAEGLMGDFKP